MKLEEFEAMVNSHDLTHAYSDDHAVWSNGNAQLKRIREAAKLFPIEDVKRIWNAKCDKTLVASEAPNWYWKD
jgi:hypothetical protein